MMDPNDDPTVLTVDKLRQAMLGAMLGVTLRRRPLEIAEASEYRCPCGGPSVLFSFDCLSKTGKAIFLCDSCTAQLVNAVYDEKIQQ